MEKFTASPNVGQDQKDDEQGIDHIENTKQALKDAFLKACALKGVDTSTIDMNNVDFVTVMGPTSDERDRYECLFWGVKLNPRDYGLLWSDDSTRDLGHTLGGFSALGWQIATIRHKNPDMNIVLPLDRNREYVELFQPDLIDAMTSPPVEPNDNILKIEKNLH